MSTTLSVAERVQNGIDLLDERGPNDWRQTVRDRLEDLDIDSCYSCVLGLIFGRYVFGTSEVGLQTCRESADAGLLVDEHANFYEESSALTAEWTRRILEDCK